MDLVVLQNKNPMASSETIAEGLGITHAQLFRTILKYRPQIEEFGILCIECRKLPGRGRPKELAWFNEEQASLLILFSSNTPEAIKFKVRLNKEFFRMRKLLLKLATQRDNSEWIQARKLGKVQRKAETDVIKEFVEYATKQGSKRANEYYRAISKAENKALFLVEQKFDNLREVLDFTQLALISVADAIVCKALKDGMEKDMDYHDIYELARDRVIELGKIHGKSIVPGFNLLT